MITLASKVIGCVDSQRRNDLKTITKNKEDNYSMKKCHKETAITEENFRKTLIFLKGRW